MPATVAASAPLPASDRAVAAHFTEQSAHADFISTFLICARSIEKLGFTAESRFARDESGRVTGFAVHAVGGGE